MIGILTDKGMALDTGRMIARINDVPFDVPSHLLVDLAACEKKSSVEYTETNKVLTRIAPVREEPPTRSPPPKLTVYDGRVLSINWTTKSIALDAGPILSFTPEQEAVVDQFKPRYKVKVEHDGERLISIKSNFVPAATHSNGNGRNEKLIAFLALHRDAVQGATICNTPDTRDYGQFMDDVFARAEDDLRRAFEKYGGA